MTLTTATIVSESKLFYGVVRKEFHRAHAWRGLNVVIIFYWGG